MAVVLIRAGLDSGRARVGTVSPPVLTTAPVAAPAAHRATTVERKRRSVRRFWTVRAGDTFGVISRRTGVPVATIERLNPKVKSTSLFIGEKIRVR